MTSSSGDKPECVSLPVEEAIAQKVIYLFILLPFRIMGKRSMSEATTFDLVLLLIISEVTQQALIGHDYSLTGAFILIVTLVSTDLIFSLLKENFQLFGKVTEGSPLIIVSDGKPLVKRHEAPKKDVLEAGRMMFGLEQMKDIKYAILEKSGDITVVPYRVNLRRYRLREVQMKNKRTGVPTNSYRLFTAIVERNLQYGKVFVNEVII